MALSLGADAFAKCSGDGWKPCVTADNRPGTRECQINGHMGPCIPDEPPKPKPGTGVSGTVHPKFYVLSIVYVPPGTKGGGTTSKVEYKQGSSMGTTVSASGSFKDGIKVTASAKAGPVVVGGQFSADNTQGTSETMEVEKSKTSGIEVTAPSSDGIDHSRDLIYFLVHPAVDVTINGNALDWTFDGKATVRYARVGWLEHPETMEKNLKAELEGKYGFTKADYQQMLKLYPFANGKTAIDPERFAHTGFNLPYTPPETPDEPVPTWTMTLDNKDTSIAGKSYESTTEAALSFGLEGGFGEVFKATIEAAKTWTWTCSNETSVSDALSQTAGFVLGGPSFGYDGGETGVDVYYDTLYKTFMFAFPPKGTPLRASGVVEFQTQGPVKGREVYLRAGGRRYRTFTNQYGEYRFYGKPLLNMEVEVEGVGKRKIGSLANPVMDFIVADKIAGSMKSR